MVSLWTSSSGALLTYRPLLQKPRWAHPRLSFAFFMACRIPDPLIKAGLSYPLSLLTDKQEFLLITDCVILHCYYIFSCFYYSRPRCYPISPEWSADPPLLILPPSFAISKFHLQFHIFVSKSLRKALKQDYPQDWGLRGPHQSLP